MKIGLAQINTRVGAIDANAHKVLDYSARARQRGCDIVLFPELTLCGYPPEDLLLHRGLRSRVEAALALVRDQVRGIAVYVGYPEYEGELVYNSAALLRDGRQLANHRKVALPNYAVFDEKRYFEPGQGGTVVELDGHTLGLISCEDAWVPGPCRAAAAAGGLSGGIDSALTLTIAVDALGADRVHAVMMPSRYTSQMSRDDAAQQAALLGVRYDVLSIEPMFDSTLAVLKDVFAGLPADTTEENIQARCRGVLLMAISNKTGKMVLTTGNKSEMAVGYATLYGDMAGGFAPLKDCAKTLVYQLAAYRNSLSPAIPPRVITRPPTAELRHDQKDSDSLPPYDVLDAILEAFIEKDSSVEQITALGFDRATVVRVLQMVKRAEYKRRQAPPGVRVSGRAFGRDWRYPITSGY